MVSSLPGLFCTTAKRLVQATREETSHLGDHMDGAAEKLTETTHSMVKASVQGAEVAGRPTDPVFYGRLSEDFDRWVSFSPEDVWVESLHRADGTTFGYHLPATQQDADISRVTSPIMDLSGVAEALEHPGDPMDSYFRGPLPAPWSAEPAVFRLHGVLDGRAMWLNADLGAGIGRSVLVVDGSTAAKVAESRGLLGAGTGKSELLLDSCESGVVGGAAESFVAQLGSSGSFSGRVVAPTDLSITCRLAGESSARVGVVANYDGNGEMQPLFREFEVQQRDVVG
ncbi:hypothetical protein ACWCPQ_12745 [Nocardia sp. NPDC001965]